MSFYLLKVWCASGVNLNGGFTKDGGCMVGASVFYSSKNKITEVTTPTNSMGSGSGGNPELDSLDRQITLAMESPELEMQFSSFVWICTSTHAASTVTVIDSKNPADILDSFSVCQTHLLCICSVIGALEKDYALLENSEITKAGEVLEKPGEGQEEVGRVEFVRVPVTKETPENASLVTTASEENEELQQTEQGTAAEPTDEPSTGEEVEGNVKVDGNS
jgi:c-Jun-amino-terminal kinase-interacting protein 4